MATAKETAAAKTATTPPVPLTLQQKFIKLREAVPSITQKAHSDGVKYKFAKIFDVYQLLTRSNTRSSTRSRSGTLPSFTETAKSRRFRSVTL